MKISEILAQREKKKQEGATGNAPSDPTPSSSSKKSIKVIRTRETPNPNALQYVLNTQVISKGKRSYSDASECAGDVMAETIFKMDGIKNVYIMDNFVTVTKNDAVGWNPLKTQVWKAIDDHVAMYKNEEVVEKPLNIDVSDFMSLSYEKKMEAVEMVLNRSIRSSLAQDGGGVDLKAIEGNEVNIHYQGACGDCPSSTTGTLQHIEKLIKQQLHRDLIVKPV